MTRFVFFFVGCLWLISIPSILHAQEDYPDHKQLSERLKRLVSEHPGLATLASLAKTDGGTDLWLLTAGSGNLTDRPAIAIVGGISGDHPAGSALALKFAEKLLQQAANDAKTKAMLDSITFYIFPDMSPDAREQYFAPLRYERLGNASPADLDRDGTIGEDPYNDLNGDGMITLMRVKDPSGAWVVHPDDERVMILARQEKGEKGAYYVFSEGIDQDKDGQYNEDGEEGVFFNKNFTFRHPAFSRGAGEHALSETETRAIADFLFSARNVFAVISFGPANNLSEPTTYSERDANARIPNGWFEQDVQVNQMISHLYLQHLNQPDQASASLTVDSVTDVAEIPAGDSGTGKSTAVSGRGISGSDGDFFQWAYFHYGRFSFSTPGWWIPEPTDKKEDRMPRNNSREDRNSDLAFLQWADKNNIDEVFVPWTRVTHPDFPGKEVEVGGIIPYVKKNPPYPMLDELANQHLAYILNLADLRPHISIENIRIEALGNGLFRLTVDILNTGSFPLSTQIGQGIRWVQKAVIHAQPDAKQELVSGKTMDIIDEMKGRSSIERSWLIRGKGNMVIKAGTESTGFAEIIVNL